MLAHLENVPTEVLPILDFEDDAFAFVRDRRARLDFVVSVSASVAIGGHNKDILALNQLVSISLRIENTLKYGMRTFFMRVSRG